MQSSFPYYSPLYPIDLLEAGADLVFKNQNSIIPKQLLTHNPTAFDIVMAYLNKEEREDFLNITDQYGESALYVFSNAQVTQYLLMNGANPDVANNSLMTPLESSIIFYLEISNKNDEYLKIILTILNASNITSYTNDYQYKIANFLKTLIQNIDDNPLKILFEKHPKIIYLLKKCIDQCETKELEPFLKDSQMQETEFKKKLASDFEKQNFGYDVIKSKITSGTFFIYFENVTINWIATGAMWYLLPLLEQHSSKGFSSHYLACHANTATLLDLILYQIGDDEYVLDEYINSGDINGNTPLHLAACFLNFQTAEIFLLNNADILATNFRGETPLSISLENVLFFYKEKNMAVDELKRNDANINMHSALLIAHKILSYCTISDIKEMAIFDKINDSPFLRHEFRDCKVLKDYAEEQELEFLRINFENRKLLTEYRKTKPRKSILAQHESTLIPEASEEAATKKQNSSAKPQRDRKAAKKAKAAASRAAKADASKVTKAEDEFGGKAGAGEAEVSAAKAQPNLRIEETADILFNIFEGIDEQLLKDARAGKPTTPISEATLNEVKTLLQSNIEALQCLRLIDNISLLSLATTIQNPRLVSIILQTAKESGIEISEVVNAQNGKFKATALCLASLNGNEDIMKILISYGADPKIKAIFPESLHLSAFDIIENKYSREPAKKLRLEKILNNAPTATAERPEYFKFQRMGAQNSTP